MSGTRGPKTSSSCGIERLQRFQLCKKVDTSQRQDEITLRTSHEPEYEGRKSLILRQYLRSDQDFQRMWRFVIHVKEIQRPATKS